MRDIGKLIFITLRDSSGTLQIGLSKKILADSWDVAKLLELGDIVGASGDLARTRTGEITIWVDTLTMLSKSLLQPPEKFHGLTDVDMRYRQRYVDLWANPEVMGTFKKRSAMIATIRRLLTDKDFNEVDFKVDGTLFMSYSDDACQNRFSSDQIDAMRATLVHRKPELITNPTIPEPLALNYQINYPIDDEFVPFDDVEFNWDKIEGANRYYIEVSLKSRFSRIVHTETTMSNTITLNDLSENRKYYWRIYAYGDAFFTGTVHHSSDIRLKKNFRPISNSLDKIRSLRGVYFD